MDPSADQEARRELADRLLAQLRPALLDAVELLASERGGTATIRRLRQVIEDVDRARQWTLHPEWKRRPGRPGRDA